MTERYRFDARRVEKPWGWELIWAEAEDYVGKLLFVRAGRVAQPPVPRGEGRGVARAGGTRLAPARRAGGPLHKTEIGPGDAFRYRPGTVHRITALEDTLVVEVSTPHLDDVVRLEDRYGREGT